MSEEEFGVRVSTMRQNEDVPGAGIPPDLPPRPPHLLVPRPLPLRPLPPHAPAYSPLPPQCPAPRERWYSPLSQKYVLLTLVVGALSVILGGLFLAIYLTVRSTTTSLHYFNTIPTYVPAAAVSNTDLFIIVALSCSLNLIICL